MNLFSGLGRSRLGEFAGQNLLCAFDFDGTLAPLVTLPERAHTPKNIIARLGELSNYARIAVITGRSVADISERLGFQPDYLIGNHGLEGVPGWEVHAASSRASCQQWISTLREALPAHPEFEHGVWIEDKTYSLSIHYRMARDRAGTERLLFTLLPELLPFARMLAGKCVINLLPPGAADKGNALEAVLAGSGAGHALYVGDDVTDEAVFRLRRSDVLSVRIGHDPRSGAEFYLPHRLCILQLLDELICRCRGFGSIIRQGVG